MGNSKSLAKVTDAVLAELRSGFVALLHMEIVADVWEEAVSVKSDDDALLAWRHAKNNIARSKELFATLKPKEERRAYDIGTAVLVGMEPAIKLVAALASAPDESTALAAIRAIAAARTHHSSVEKGTERLRAEVRAWVDTLLCTANSPEAFTPQSVRATLKAGESIVGKAVGRLSRLEALEAIGLADDVTIRDKYNDYEVCYAIMRRGLAEKAREVGLPCLTGLRAVADYVDVERDPTFTGTKCYIKYDRPSTVAKPALDENKILSLVAEVRSSKADTAAISGAIGRAANEWGNWAVRLKRIATTDSAMLQVTSPTMYGI